VPSIVAVTDLTKSSSDDEEVSWLMENLEVGVSEALGISLSEVCACYSWDSDEGKDRELDSECECQLEYQSYREDIAFE
jgi:hypothetical protein